MTRNTSAGLLGIACGHLRRGWHSIPIPYQQKAPRLDAWQTLRLGEADLPKHFTGEPSNIGVLLGEPSDRLVDIDLDAAEAVARADAFLPKTSSVFGRLSKPRSHWLYTCEIETQKFSDVDGTMLVEIRSTGGQTVFPGSTHPNGESIEWAEDGEPAAVEAADLRRAVVRLASACMLGRHWPGTGARHEAALAAAGFLCRAGVDEENVVKIITAAARVAGDGEWSDRKRAALDTIAAIRADESATGGPRLAELIVGDGAKVVERMRRWLGADEERHEGEHTLADLGNAGRLIAQYGEDLRYAYGLRAWFAWSGTRWQRDPGDLVMARAKQMVRSIYAEAVAATDSVKRAAIAGWARKSEHEARLRAAVFLAQSEPGVPAEVSRFDADPWTLNVSNGTVDLRTGQLRPYRREDYCTKVAPVTYDPAADCPSERQDHPLEDHLDGVGRLCVVHPARDVHGERPRRDPERCGAASRGAVRNRCRGRHRPAFGGGTRQADDRR
jgi:hypothetical protein